MLRKCSSLMVVLMVASASQGVSAEPYQQATRQAVYEAQSRRYVSDRTRRVTPRVNSASQRLIYVDRSTRYDGNVYSGYGNQSQARIVRGRDYVTPATVSYATVDNRSDVYGRVDDGEVDRVVVVQQNDDSRRYAGYARYKNGRSYSGYSSGYRSHGDDRVYYPQPVYQASYHRPVYVSHGYAYGHGYRHHGRHYGHHYGHGYSPYYGSRCGSGSYGHFGYHRGGHHSHTGISFHFRF